MDVDVFFPAFYAVLPSQGFVPRRNTMDEVLNAGHLHLTQDSATRAKVLDLYALYGRIAAIQDHTQRDYHVYLYDATFSSVSLKPEGPWATDADAVADAKGLVTSVTVANGLRLAVFNVEKVLLPDLRRAEAQLQELASLMASASL